ncbi:MAG: hypothetical protein ACFFB6_01335 [Promethearchaeota archaeon]
MLARLKPSVREILIIYSSGLITIILSIIFFSIKGYPLVVTANETLDIFTPPLYMISVFLPFGILIGEVIWLWNERKERFRYLLLFFECIIVGIFSFIRFVISIPFSGHAIILLFYLLHQAINNKFNHPIRFLIGMIVLVITVIYKIYLWNDPITFLLGLSLGIVLWLPGFLYRYKKFKRS